MNLLLFQKLIYKTNLPIEDVLQGLINNVDDYKPFNFESVRSTYSKRYVGKVRKSSFEIYRVLNYKNSFNPQIQGQIFQEAGEIKVVVKMMLHPAILAILTFMYIFLIGISVITTYQLFTKEFNPLFLMPQAMLVFLIIIPLGFFNSEAKTSKDDLKKILGAEIR